MGAQSNALNRRTIPDSLVKKMINQFATWLSEKSKSAPEHTVQDMVNEMYVLEVPGVDENSIRAVLSRRSLTITGERVTHKRTEDAAQAYTEDCSTKFRHRINLPRGIDTDRITVNLTPQDVIVIEAPRGIAIPSSLSGFFSKAPAPSVRSKSAFDTRVN